jgi:hypothetical protein
VTEAEWLACADPSPMLSYLAGKASDRKLRLFACACVRRIWHFLRYPETWRPVEVSERHVDGLAELGELEAAYEATRVFISGLMGWADEASCCPADPDATQAATVASLDAAREVSARCYRSNIPNRDERAAQCDVFRCILGNPFRPSPPLPTAVLAWNDRTIPRLAEAIYKERKLPEGTLDPGRLAILADALLNAGYDDEGLLAHLRSPGPHVRGCWAVDAVLGKS